MTDEERLFARVPLRPLEIRHSRAPFAVALILAALFGVCIGATLTAALAVFFARHL